ncbi:MAG TPA: aspartate 1-decarboxylase [Verrucomicrobiales bacterium]|nr:aspartate 1-decarboxylase [Verrucomicrobiales bacterium]HCN77516.1 aspartate 1-decarboxylase [Verrucomicrobiales bacterium]HRJ07915.1 aspartate 1-decarboxylase [Prosthecobacter sp.]HRK16188.1 aspartate 1-decarboxylase [Prosthecobacter sp.]
MLRTLLLSKIHRAAVTDASVDYEGSLAIDIELMDACGMAPYERILVSNMSNAKRFETYAIEAPAGSRTIQLNGAAAHLGKPGDRVTIMSFAQVTPEQMAAHQPKVIVLNERNEIVNHRGI